MIYELRHLPQLALLIILCAALSLSADNAPSAKSESSEQSSNKLPTDSVRCFVCRTQAEQKLEDLLQAAVDFDYVNTPLKEVLVHAVRELPVNLVIDEEGMSQKSLAADTPVSIRLRQISLEEGLRLLLTPLEMSYLVCDGALIVTSVEVAEEHYETRIYDITALSIAPLALQALIPEHSRGMWMESNGHGGVIHTLSDCIIVTQTQSVHRRIQAFLNLLSQQAETSSVATPREILGFRYDPPGWDCHLGVPIR